MVVKIHLICAIRDLEAEKHHLSDGLWQQQCPICRVLIRHPANKALSSLNRGLARMHTIQHMYAFYRSLSWLLKCFISMTEAFLRDGQTWTAWQKRALANAQWRVFRTRLLTLQKITLQDEYRLLIAETCRLAYMATIARLGQCIMSSEPHN